MTASVRMAAVITLLCALLACHSKPGAPRAVKQYDFRGVVVEVHRAQRELRVKHEDIPGYMRAMTMNFPVKDEAALNSVAAGDEITAKLNVAGPGEYWLSDIRKVAAPARSAQ